MQANLQLRSIIDRILRLKEEQDAIGDDIREIYLEAKGNGYDKTALGKVVSHLRAKAKDANKLEEQEAIVELYLSSYETASHAHAREAKADAPSAKLGASVGGAEYSVSEASRPNAPGPLGAASVAREAA